MKNIRAVADVAARWHARAMSGRLSAEDEQRLDAWLAEDLQHRLAYAEVAAAGYALQQVAPNVAREKRAPKWPIWLGAALAPILLFVAVIWMPHTLQDWRSDLRTAAGALRSERLPDGSTLQLDTDSAVSLPFSPEHREVELLRGALAVEVAKDPAHPFLVHCARVEARAVGTRFIVARQANTVEVGVIEGVVAVRADDRAEPVLVHAGERVLVDQRDRVIRDLPLPATGYAWTRGVLSFEHVPLQQVVAEIARYLPEHVVFRATSRADMPVTATFPLDHPDAALRAVAASHELTLRHVPNLLYVIQD